FILTAIIVFFISVLVTKKIVTPIKKLSAWAKQVGSGELVSKKVKAPKNEVGEMVDTFNNLVESLQSYAKVSESAAYGDYSKTVMIRSKEDVLGKSMNQMVESFRNVVDQANRIAKGDYSTNITPRSDKDTLGIALYKMTKTLRETSTEVQQQDWFKSGMNQLESILSGLKNIRKLTDEIINFLIHYLEAQIGLLYIYEDGKLKLEATYAYKDIQNKFTEFEVGQGIIGQVAKDQKQMAFNLPAEITPKLNIGIDERKPLHLITAPVIFENETKGVIQIGSLKEFSELQLDFFSSCLDNIAVAINTIQVHTRVQRLLKQTQKQANELQVQQEELRQANEELEEQTKALKLSEENLKSQQEELRVTNEELEERTNDLELERDNIRKKNEELKKAREEIEIKARDLEQASKYKSEFLANMSHELRTPLNSILVLSQLLSENRKDHLDQKEIQFAKTINTSGSDLLELINEILDLSKVESGKLELEIEDTYLSEVKSFVMGTFKPLTNEKGLELNFEQKKDVPKVLRTDSQRLMQILKNLISNAVKFTKEGEVKLSVGRPDNDMLSGIFNLKKEDSVAFSVIDTGIGIPEDKLEYIFEAFKQADGTTSRKFGGTGLGLTISRKFTELLQGALIARSKENMGSAFTLILPENFNKTGEPAEQYKPDKNEEAKAVASKKTREKIKGKQDKYHEIIDDKDDINQGDHYILIIEDDVNFCQVLYELSHEKNFKALIALDGETGLHYADYYLPEAIILDIGLPGIDGYEVMKRLKENSRTRHIPVHIISAADKSLDAMKMGAIGYLTKPVDHGKLEEVFKKLENVISRPIKKALVVEDDPIMRKSIVKLLDEGNVEIKSVDSGEKAIELLKKQRFECLILDLGLKELSGFDLLEQIRRDKKINDLPVIIYTGQDLSPEENEKLQKYADSIILKGARSFERLLSEATLFLHQVHKDMPKDKQSMLEKLQGKPDTLKGKKVLIVDDDMRNVFALASVLEENGMKVIIGKNGREGVEKLNNNPDTNLVLMDIMMPEMDGYEAMMEIRKQKKFEKLPIIALTAKAMKEDRAKCIAAGANDYLAKPVNTDKLISLLRVWLYNN
ncbi:MAG: response regulator, partial [Bacteroidales bacterium]|nr:response regulator [Bacteroidales bacterium]